MKSAIEYALSLSGICINKCDVTSAKESVDDKVTKEWWLDERSVFHK